MMFWAAMAQPGAIGGLLLGEKPPGCTSSACHARAKRCAVSSPETATSCKPYCSIRSGNVSIFTLP